jgi:hypothetical protein
VPCLAGLYLALGDDAAPGPPPVSVARRAIAAVAACVLGMSAALWPAAPATIAADRPAATLPEWPDLAPADVVDAGE